MSTCHWWPRLWLTLMLTWITGACLPLTFFFLSIIFSLFLSRSHHHFSFFSFFRTRAGVHQGPDGEVTSPVLMWVEAVQLFFDRLSHLKTGTTPIDLKRIVAISGAGQVRNFSSFSSLLPSSPHNFLFSSFLFLCFSNMAQFTGPLAPTTTCGLWPPRGRPCSPTFATALRS